MCVQTQAGYLRLSCTTNSSTVDVGKQGQKTAALELDRRQETVRVLFSDHSR